MFKLIFWLFIYYNIFYFIAMKKNDISLIDIAWGPSFALIYWVGLCYIGTAWGLREWIMGLLISIWALRLAGYIFYRSRKLGKEDYRYTKMREGWGHNYKVIAYFRVYIFQGVLALVIGLPLYLYHFNSKDLHFGNHWDILGIVLWLIGFLFETIGDWQKNKFKNNPENQGKVCNIGLWRYTRHPNYFGDACLWWGLYCFTLNFVPFYQSIWGPLLLNFFLLKVSGVALLEKKYEGNEDYINYQKLTNAFLPWFPKQR